MNVLPDGVYDVFVVDAVAAPAQGEVLMHLDLTITSGEHKGEVVEISSTDLGDDEIDLMGMPATLTVTDGRPVVVIDR